MRNRPGHPHRPGATPRRPGDPLRPGATPRRSGIQAVLLAALPLGSAAGLGLGPGCAYTAPVVPATDPATGLPRPLTNVLAGEVVLAAPGDAVGPVVVFVTDAANPMPPLGTGRPRAAATVPARLFRAEGGLIAAPFSVSGVPDGEWIVTAVMDRDGNFNPISSAMAGATCGDVGGAYLADLATGTLAPVAASGGEAVEGLTVVLGSVFPIERPAFSIDGFGAGGGEVDSAAAAVDPTSQGYTLRSTGIASSAYQLDGPDAFGTEACGTKIPLYAPDADGDGQFDPHPTYGALGLYDVWPKAYVSYLGEPEVQEDGTVRYAGLPAGESWAGENVPHPRYTLLGQVLPGETVFLDSADFTWLPAARHFTPENPEGEVVQDVALLPKGAWSVTLIAHTGQTWTVPNDLARYPAQDGSGFDPLTQRQWMTLR